MTADGKNNAANARARADARTGKSGKKGSAAGKRGGVNGGNPVAAEKRNRRSRPLGGRLAYRGGFPVFASRYVLFGGDSPRAALRFYNGSDVLLTGLRFLVTETDGEGRTIAEYTLSRRGLNAESGTEFAVADFPVGADCVALEIKTQSAISEPYEYVVEDDGASVKYGVEEEKEEFYFRKKPTLSVKKRKRTLAVLSAAALLAVVLAAGCTAWRLGVFGGNLRQTSDGSDTDIAVIQDVEA